MPRRKAAKKIAGVFACSIVGHAANTTRRHTHTQHDFKKQNQEEGAWLVDVVVCVCTSVPLAFAKCLKCKSETQQPCVCQCVSVCMLFFFAKCQHFNFDFCVQQAERLQLWRAQQNDVMTWNSLAPPSIRAASRLSINCRRGHCRRIVYVRAAGNESQPKLTLAHIANPWTYRLTAARDVSIKLLQFHLPLIAYLRASRTDTHTTTHTETHLHTVYVNVFICI